MAIEEKVIQPESVTNAEQPVAETTSQPQAPNLDAIKAEYEAKLAAARKEATEAQEKFKGIKTKLDDVYKQKEEKRTKELEDQGQWKTLWEEANKTAQEKDQQISTLSQQLEDMKVSKEVESTRTKAFAGNVPVANSGAGTLLPRTAPQTDLLQQHSARAHTQRLQLAIELSFSRCICNARYLRLRLVLLIPLRVPIDLAGR